MLGDWETTAGIAGGLGWGMVSKIKEESYNMVGNTVTFSGTKVRF